MDYLTLLASEKRILNTRTGEVWAEIAPFSIAEVMDRSVVEARWPGEQLGSRLIVSPGGAAAEGEENIAQAFRAWSGTGKEALEVGMRVLVEVCRDRGCELLVWPRLGSLVSDIPGLLSVTRKHEGVGILLDPAAIFPEGDQFQLADFVDRLTEVMPLPGVRAIFFDAERSEVVGGRSVFAPLMRIASDLKKPVVLHGVSPEHAGAIFGLEPG